MLEDGSIANVEIQKVGYRFPGERSACYSSDLLLRQYKRVRGRKKKELEESTIQLEESKSQLEEKDVQLAYKKMNLIRKRNFIKAH